MRGSLGLLLFFAVAAVGCQSPSAMSDPFVRARVPAPATGQLGPVPNGTYGTISAPPPPAGQYAPPGGNFSYGGGPLAPVTPPPSAPPPANFPGAAPYGSPAAPTYQSPPPPAALPAAPSANGPPYTPPGGGWAPTSSSGGPATSSIYDRAAMQREIRPLAESARAGLLADAAGDGANDNGAAPGQIVIEPLNRIKETPMASPLRGARDTRAIEPVSYTAPQGAPPRTIRGPYASAGKPGSAPRATTPAAAGQAAATTPLTSGSGPADRGATYGYDGNYAWLQGQLEYSQAAKQWKLRYIPIDGPTDQYGGSVVLAGTPALNGSRAGDFVSVKGQLDSGRTSQGSFAPQYRVTNVDRLSD
jgi:hypothetical protein